MLYDNSLASSYLTRSDSRAMLFRLWYKYVDTLTPRSEKRNAQQFEMALGRMGLDFDSEAHVCI